MSLAQPMRVALVEDHAATRAAMAQALVEEGAGIELVGTFASGEDFLGSCPRAGVDVVLIDLGLPGLSGNDVIRSLARETPTLKVIALTVFDDEDSVFNALAAGAHGFLLKDEPIERVISAVEDVLAGRRPLSSSVTHFLIDQALRFTTRITLTERESEVALVLSKGSSYAECGERFGIAIGTVQDHVKRIYRKLGVSSKRELKLWVEQSQRAS